MNALSFDATCPPGLVTVTELESDTLSFGQLAIAVRLLAFRSTQMASTSFTRPSPVTSPKTLTGGAIAVMVVLFTTFTADANRDPTLTVAPLMKLDPDTVIDLPPPPQATAGLTDSIAGAVLIVMEDVPAWAQGTVWNPEDVEASSD